MLHHHSPDCTCLLPDQSGQSDRKKVRRLGIAFLLIACFAATELGVGWWSHSLALQAEAGHKISDSFALALSWVTAWMGQSHFLKTQRLEAGAALVNGIGLLAIAIEIAREAMINLQSTSTEILSLPLLITACVALVIDSLNVTLLHESIHNDLNVRAAFLHILVDVMSSVGVLLAAFAVYFLHWIWADSAISLFLSAAIALSTIPLIGQSLRLMKKETE